MAYRLNRRCGPGSGIRHGAMVLNPPVRPKPTRAELHAALTAKLRAERKHVADRALRTQQLQHEAAATFAEHLATPGYEPGERKRLGLTGNPKKGGTGTTKRQRRRNRKLPRFSGALQPRRRAFIRREVER